MSVYRIGKVGLFTNEDLKADAATLDGQVNRLDDADMTKVSQTFFDAWWNFRGEWKRFYSNTILGSFFGPAWNDANRDQLIQFEERYADFAAQYAQQTGHALPDVVAPNPTGPEDSFGDHFKKAVGPALAVVDSYKWWILGGAVLFFFREPIVGAVKAAVGKVKS